MNGYSYRYNPAAGVKTNVSRSTEMDPLRVRLAPTASDLVIRARLRPRENGHGRTENVPGVKP